MPRREREQVARDLKPIYTATDADQAHAELEAFDEKWGQRFPVITQAWLNAWEYVTPFLAFPPEVRRVIYTTDENVKGGDGASWVVLGEAIGRGGCSQGRRSAPVASSCSGSAGPGRFSGSWRPRRGATRRAAAVRSR